jgi:hypothetical protein
MSDEWRVIKAWSAVGCDHMTIRISLPVRPMGDKWRVIKAWSAVGHDHMTTVEFVYNEVQGTLDLSSL